MTDREPSKLANLARKPEWRLFDEKCRVHFGRYVLQTLMATATMLIVLLLLDMVEQTVLIASLGASTFIVFSMPHTHRSEPRYLIGGYLVGAVAGCSLSLIADWLNIYASFDPRVVDVCFAALALGISFFLMVITDTEHPPAAALALGFVLNEWDLFALFVVMSGICLISAIRQLMKPRLMDLL